MKHRYNLDKQAPKHRHADHTVVVPRSLFSRFENRHYIVRNTPDFLKIKTIKIIQKQNHETRYFELANDIRPRLKPRTVNEFQW